MKVIETAIPEVKILEPKVFTDARGFFFENFNQGEFKQLTGLSPVFVQDNHSKSVKGVLRGLHYQLPPKTQGKLVRVTRGEVFDVALDIRKSSATFGQWMGTFLSEENKRLMWIPEGFAHGFITLSEVVEFQYKMTDYYTPALERCIRWDDPDIGIQWPCDISPILSPKDACAIGLKEADLFS